ncbi:MAG: OmpA family protein [Hyphomicrobium sp.]
MFGGLLRIIAGLALALLAAALVGVLTGSPFVPAASGAEPPIVTAWRGLPALLPLAAPLALIAAAIGEDRGWRWWLAWTLAGALAATLAGMALDIFGGAAALPRPAGALSLVAMGATAGLVYWSVAGWRAGAFGATSTNQGSEQGERRRCVACAVVGLLAGAIPLAALGWQAFHRTNGTYPEQIITRAETDASTLLSAAGLSGLSFKIKEHVGRITGEVATTSERDQAFATASKVLAPLVGVPGVVATLQNDIVARASSNPDVTAENARIAAAEADAKRRAEEELRWKAEEAARVAAAAEAEAKRRAEEELRLKAEQAARVAAAAEAEAKRRAEEELRLKAEEAARVAAAAEAEAKRRAEEELRVKAEEAARVAAAAEAEAKRRAEEELRLKAEEAARVAAAAEAEAKRRAEEELRLKAEEAARVAAAAEAEAKRRAEEELRLKAEEAARVAAAAEADAKRRAEEELRLKAEEAARVAAAAANTAPSTAPTSPDAAANAGSKPEPVVETTPAERARCLADLSDATKTTSIRFAMRSAALSKHHAADLDRLAAVAKTCSGVMITIQGHSDITGPAAANQTLSEERAEAVRAALVERGVKSAILSSEGLGETKPRNPARNRQAFRENRRAEFAFSGATTREKSPPDGTSSPERKPSTP